MSAAQLPADGRSSVSFKRAAGKLTLDLPRHVPDPTAGVVALRVD